MHSTIVSLYLSGHLTRFVLSGFSFVFCNIVRQKYLCYLSRCGNTLPLETRCKGSITARLSCALFFLQETPSTVSSRLGTSRAQRSSRHTPSSSTPTNRATLDSSRAMVRELRTLCCYRLGRCLVSLFWQRCWFLGRLGDCAQSSHVVRALPLR